MSGGSDSLVKAPIYGHLLVDWFTKSLLLTISKDVSMVGVATKEKTVWHAQHLNLIYS